MEDEFCHLFKSKSDAYSQNLSISSYQYNNYVDVLTKGVTLLTFLFEIFAIENKFNTSKLRTVIHQFIYFTLYITRNIFKDESMSSLFHIDN